MSRPLPLLIFLLLCGVLAYWFFTRPSVGPAARETERKAVSATEVQMAPAQVAPQATAAPEEQNPAAKDGSSRERTAYLLQLQNGGLSLIQAQEVEGDFAPDQGRREAFAGMLRCRLVAGDGRVLAEEVLPAPDQLCMVLDTTAGQAKPVAYTVPGPVVFQVRLPRFADATRLDVFRVSDSGTLARDPLVGSIPLFSK